MIRGKEVPTKLALVASEEALTQSTEQNYRQDFQDLIGGAITQTGFELGLVSVAKFHILPMGAIVPSTV